jgi:hypothetical protein
MFVEITTGTIGIITKILCHIAVGSYQVIQSAVIIGSAYVQQRVSNALVCKCLYWNGAIFIGI